MDGIGGYLQKKLATLTPPERIIKKAFCTVVAEQFGYELPLDQVRVQSQTIYVTGSSALKAEIFLQKAELLTKLAQRLNNPKQKITDIR